MPLSKLSVRKKKHIFVGQLFDFGQISSGLNESYGRQHAVVDVIICRSKKRRA